MCRLLPPASEGWGKVLFSVCLSVHISGGGVPQSGLGRRVPQSGLGGTPSQVWVGGTPSQVWGGTPSPGGVPHVQGGTPSLGGTPCLGGTPSLVPPPIAQSSIVSTCYAAGSASLAFTQEDFLVSYIFKLAKAFPKFMIHSFYWLHAKATQRTKLLLEKLKCIQ